MLAARAGAALPDGHVGHRRARGGADPGRRPAAGADRARRRRSAVHGAARVRRCCGSSCRPTSRRIRRWPGRTTRPPRTRCATSSRRARCVTCFPSGWTCSTSRWSPSDATSIEIAAVMARAAQPDRGRHGRLAVRRGGGGLGAAGAPARGRVRRVDHLVGARGVRRGVRADRHRTDPPGRRGPRRRGGHGAARCGRREHGVLQRGHRRRLERHLPAARDDDHRQHRQADRGVRVPRDLVGQAGPGAAVRRDGDADRDHRRGLGAARQRDDRAAGGPGDAAGVRPAGRAAGPVPDRRGDGLQHRRHRHPDRRPAQHHHREPVRADLQRLPAQPGAADHRAGRGAGAAVPVDVPVRLRLRRGPCRQGHAARRARGHQGQAPAGAVRRRPVAGDGRLHRPRCPRHRPVAGRAAGRRRAGRGVPDPAAASSSRTSSG